MSAEIKFIIRMAKYTWQDYKTNEDIIPELKINPVVKKKYKTTEINGYNMFGEWTETNRLSHSIVKHEPCGK
jgi:hypothetical protein